MTITPTGPSDHVPAVVAISGTVVPSLPDTATWPGLVDAWLGSYSSERTQQNYAREARRWTAWCELLGAGPMHATRVHADAYLRHLEAEGEADATRARRLAAVSSLYKYAQSLGTLKVPNPCEHVRRPKVDQDNSTSVGLTEAEALGMLRWAEAERPRTHALVALLLLGGLRVSEALSVRAEDLAVDRGHRVLAVAGKGGKVRRLAVAPSLGHALDVQLGGRSKGLILATATGRPWDRSEAWRAVRRIAKAAAVAEPDKIGPHTLRHSAVTFALQSGQALDRVQDFAGHSDPRTTQRYNRRRGQLDGHAAYALDDYLAGKAAG
jgi:site-specific recombinase XerD